MSAPIFISARFRSGSTMLWRIFDETMGYRAFYEPCHDTLPAHIRHTSPMESHRGVVAYWESYLPLLDAIEEKHDAAFGLDRLLLEADASWPELDSYLRTLVKSSELATAVLQFNRMDFRLPWLRAAFPDARIVHLWRDPRASWFSMIGHLPDDWRDDPLVAHVYDLLEWSFSLARDLPFLADPAITSLYERHYLIWRLSKLMGERVADCSVEYDAFGASGSAIRELESCLQLSAKAVETATRIADVQPTRRRVEVEPEEGFDVVETRCDARLASLGLVESFGAEPLSEIRARHADAWREVDAIDRGPITTAMLRAHSSHRAEVTRLLDIVRAER